MGDLRPDDRGVSPVFRFGKFIRPRRTRLDPTPQGETLRRWIEAGAPWPDELAEPKHWAYTPIVRPQVPHVDDADSPIDQFVDRRLAEKGLQPNPGLDRPRLLRR